jgi:hypothetical protein
VSDVIQQPATNAKYFIGILECIIGVKTIGLEVCETITNIKLYLDTLAPTY